MTNASTPSPDEPVPLDQVEHEEQLDEEEKEFRALRRDLPGVKGASVAGIVPFWLARRSRRTNSSGRIATPIFDPLCRWSMWR